MWKGQREFGGRHSQRKGAKRLPESKRRRVLREHPVCYFAFPDICTVQSEEVHHIVDDADGGTDDYDNLVGACKPCHIRHSARESAKRGASWKRQRERHPGLDS